MACYRIGRSGLDVVEGASDSLGRQGGMGHGRCEEGTVSEAAEGFGRVRHFGGES